MYATVDRPDTKQYREFYTTPDVLEAVRAGKPVPDGAVIVLAAYMAQVDAAGVPLKDADGRYLKGNLAAVNVQQKKKGWGDDIPAAIRNGDWVYQPKNVSYPVAAGPISIGAGGPTPTIRSQM